MDRQLRPRKPSKKTDPVPKEDGHLRPRRHPVKKNSTPVSDRQLRSSKSSTKKMSAPSADKNTVADSSAQSSQPTAVERPHNYFTRQRSRRATSQGAISAGPSRAAGATMGGHDQESRTPQHNDQAFLEPQNNSQNLDAQPAQSHSSVIGERGSDVHGDLAPAGPQDPQVDVNDSNGKASNYDKHDGQVEHHRNEEEGGDHEDEDGAEDKDGARTQEGAGNGLKWEPADEIAIETGMTVGEVASRWAKKDFKDFAEYSSEARELAGREAKRWPRAKPFKKEPDWTRAGYVRSVLVQICGTRNNHSCTSCTGGHGRFIDCVRIEAEGKGACASCTWSTKNKKCEWHIYHRAGWYFGQVPDTQTDDGARELMQIDHLLDSIRHTASADAAVEIRGAQERLNLARETLRLCKHETQNLLRKYGQ